MKTMIVALGATLFAATLAVAQPSTQQCPISCSGSPGTCNSPAGVSCNTNADCVAATVAATCPCDGPSAAAPWKNHGQYQVCVVHERNTLRKEGCSVARIASCSARSTCGKPGAEVLCCKLSTGTCNGTCSNKPALNCSSNADCTVVSGPHIRKDATSCTDFGGFVSGTGSVCSGCTVACCVAGACQVTTSSACTAQGGTPNATNSCTNVTCM
jgi:hypothetical protein